MRDIYVEYVAGRFGWSVLEEISPNEFVHIRTFSTEEAAIAFARSL